MYVTMGFLVGAYIFKNPSFGKMIPVVHGNPQYDYMLPVFILLKIPPGIRAVIFAAILAAVMSSMDSAINSLSAATMRDFFEKFVNFGDDNRKYLFFSRLTTVFWGTFVTVFAFAFGGGSKTIVESINAIGSMFYGPILAAFLLGVATRRTSGVGVITGVVFGVATNLILKHFFGNNLSWMWWNLSGFVVTFVVALAVSIFVPEDKLEKINQLIVWTSDHLAEEKRWIPTYAALAGYFVFMLLLAYFVPKMVTGG